MSYPHYMTDEQLVTYGFVVFPDDPNKAYCKLYPKLSFRHKCQTCGIWSDRINGECRRCLLGKKPVQPTKQYYKLYLCCEDDGCSVRTQALSLVRDVGIDHRWPSHDGYGPYIDLGMLRSLPEAERMDFFLAVNEISVSKFGARKLRHEGSKMKSKLPKR